MCQCQICTFWPRVALPPNGGYCLNAIKSSPRLRPLDPVYSATHRLARDFRPMGSQLRESQSSSASGKIGASAPVSMTGAAAYQVECQQMPAVGAEFFVER
jgi:hypothetical protein